MKKKLIVIQTIIIIIGLSITPLLYEPFMIQSRPIEGFGSITISGTVTDTLGNGVSGATIRLMDYNGIQVSTASSSSSGSYSLSYADSPNNYLIKATKPGYPDTNSYGVSGRTDSTVNFVMEIPVVFNNMDFTYYASDPSYVSIGQVDNKETAHFVKPQYNHAQLSSRLSGTYNKPIEALVKFKYQTIGSSSWSPVFQLNYPRAGFRVYLMFQSSYFFFGGPGTGQLSYYLYKPSNTWYDLRIRVLNAGTGENDNLWDFDIAFKQEDSNSWTTLLNIQDYSITLQEEPYFEIGTSPRTDYSIAGNTVDYYFANPSFGIKTDRDSDGLTDIQEMIFRSNGIMVDPNSADTDHDGLLDGVELDSNLSARELKILYADPEDKNRNENDDKSEDRVVSNGYTHWMQSLNQYVTYYSNPLVADADGDGLNDKEEKIQGSNPNLYDTDGDGINDRNDWYPTIVDTQAPSFLDISDQIFQHSDGTIIDVPGTENAYFKLNMNANDISAFENSGTLYNGVGFITGKSGAAASFDGYNDYIRVPSSDELSVDYLTLMAWVYPYSRSSYAIILNKESDYEVALDNGQIKWAIHTPSKSWFWVSTGVYVDNYAWNNIAISYDGSSVLTYVNAELVHSYSYSYGSISKSGHDLGLGARGVDASANSFYHGAIDEVQIYGKALSQERIREIYFRTSLVAHYRFDDNSFDHSKNGMDLTVSGASYQSGKIVRALQFDGYNDYAYKAEHSTLDMVGTISFGGWIKPDSYPSSGSDILVMKRAAYYLTMDASGRIGAYFYGLSSPGYHWSDSSIPINEWSHVFVSYDGATITIYIDGKVDKTIEATGSITNSDQNLYIGGDAYANSRYFDGFIDDVRIYAIPANTNDVQWISEGAKPSDEGLSLYVKIVGNTYYSVFQVQDNRGIDEIRLYTTGLIPNVYYTVYLYDYTGVQTEVWSWGVQDVLGYGVHIEAKDKYGGVTYQSEELSFYVNSKLDNLFNIFKPAADFLMAGVDWVMKELVDPFVGFFASLGQKAIDAAIAYVEFYVDTVTAMLGIIAQPAISLVENTMMDLWTGLVIFIDNYDPILDGNPFYALKAIFDPFTDPIKDLLNSLGDYTDLLNLMSYVFDAILAISGGGLADLAMRLMSSTILAQFSSQLNDVTNMVGNVVFDLAHSVFNTVGDLSAKSTSSMRIPSITKTLGFVDALDSYGLISAGTMHFIDLLRVDISSGSTLSLSSVEQPSIADQLLIATILGSLVSEVFTITAEYRHDIIKGHNKYYSYWTTSLFSYAIALVSNFLATINEDLQVLAMGLEFLSLQMTIVGGFDALYEGNKWAAAFNFIAFGCTLVSEVIHFTHLNSGEH